MNGNCTHIHTYTHYISIIIIYYNLLYSQSSVPHITMIPIMLRLLNHTPTHIQCNIFNKLKDVGTRMITRRINKSTTRTITRIGLLYLDLV